MKLVNTLLISFLFCVYSTHARSIIEEEKALDRITNYMKPDNYTACMLKACGAELTKCALDPVCAPGAICSARCDVLDASCFFNCMMRYGQYSDQFATFIDCAVASQCLPAYDPPTCYVEDADGLRNMTTVEQIQGEWWVVRGVNPIYDLYPCQHSRFMPSPVVPEAWINNVTWKDPYARNAYVKADPFVTVPSPGVYLHNYTDVSLKGMSEKWIVVSKPVDDWMFMLWCGGNPILDYGGGIVFVRDPTRTMDNIPKWINDTFRATALIHGIDYDTEMWAVDNTKCTV